MLAGPVPWEGWASGMSMAFLGISIFFFKAHLVMSLLLFENQRVIIIIIIIITAVAGCILARLYRALPPKTLE